jgi:hypothetical protein
MSKSTNPLLPALMVWLDYKRAKNGLVPKNRLLIALRLLDAIYDCPSALHEDDLYTYDFTLKESRQNAIIRVKEKYGFPQDWKMSDEGVTVRGAPGLRMFRAWQGGGVLAELSTEKRRAALDQAIELVREEVLKVLGQHPVELPSNVFEHTAKFAPALLEKVRNRSSGRVEQALVGAKLHLRFPNIPIADHAGFAGDQQTGRQCDFEAGRLRVIVSVTPKPNHFESAKLLADEGHEVYLVVSQKALKATTDRIARDLYDDRITVESVAAYVTKNMKEIATDRNLSSKETCLMLVAEYNRRIAFDRDHSLQVVLPAP